MPVYQVVRCAGDCCGKYQTQQQKKLNKWTCVVCGLKQSLKRAYFESAAPKECRAAVMELNMKQGLVQENANQLLVANAHKNTGNALQQTTAELSEPSVSKWAEFMDDKEELHDGFSSNSCSIDKTSCGNDIMNLQTVVRSIDSPALHISTMRSKTGKQTVKAARKNQSSSCSSIMPSTSVRQKAYQTAKPARFKDQAAPEKHYNSSTNLSQALSEMIQAKAHANKASSFDNSNPSANIEQKPQHEKKDTAVDSIEKASKWNEFESSSEAGSDSDSD